MERYRGGERQRGGRKREKSGGEHGKGMGKGVRGSCQLLTNWVCLKISRRRRTPQDATDRRKTPQNAHSYEIPMYYGMFHTLMYE